MGLRHIVLLLSTLYLCCVEVEPETVNKKIYCGQHLSATLSTVCKGNYNTLTKKSTVYNRRGYWESQYTADEPISDVSHPYISKNSATSLITQFRRRRKRGVYNECCEKACSYEELLSYCA